MAYTNLMNWLLITPANTVSDFAQLQSVFAKQQIHMCILETDTEGALSHKALMDAVRDAAYCVMNKASLLCKNDDILFALGYMIGKGVSVFMTERPENSRYNYFSDQLFSFTSVAALSQSIEEHLPEYMAVINRKQALDSLVSRGIPFTPDCFSFHIASDNMRECSLFIAAGMDVNSCDSAGVSMLNIASRTGKLDMVTWLLAHGADINAIARDRGYTPVMDAIWKTKPDIVEVLVNHGADLNVISKDGQPPLVLAVGNGNETICRLLVEYGADPLIKDSMGMSALDYARLFKKDRLVSLFEKYVQKEEQ